MCRLIAGWLAKNSHASSHDRSRISAMFLPRNVMSSVSRLYRAPLQTSHGTYTSGRKCISILIVPSPAHASQRPPFTLKLNRPCWYPRIFDAGVRGRIRPRRATDRRLVDVDDLVERVGAVDALVLPRHRARAVDPLHQRVEEDVVDERALPAAAHAGDRDEAPERDADV